MKIGIFATGKIARTMAGTINQLPEAELYAVASRDIEKARAFCAEFGAAKAYGSYEELAADPEVELVYIATPHSEHYNNMKLCLRYKKPMLCEKAFTANAAQAKEVLAEAAEKRVFIAEAIWTRYMPIRKQLDDVVNSGVIGKPLFLSANLGYVIENVPRMADPALAGGALLDLGVYPLNFALMAFGGETKVAAGAATLTDRGVDSQDSFTLVWPDGRMASLYATMRAKSDQCGIIYFERGTIIVKQINTPVTFSVYDSDKTLIKEYSLPMDISGYEYEVLECIEAVKNGEIEPLSMPHSETIRVMEIMDSLRGIFGVRYPFE